MRVSKDILKLVPNQSEAVKSLAEQYKKFAKASSEDILGLAEIVYIANREPICGTSRSSTTRLALTRRARQRASSKRSARS